MWEWVFFSLVVDIFFILKYKFYLLLLKFNTQFIRFDASKQISIKQLTPQLAVVTVFTYAGNLGSITSIEIVTWDVLLGCIFIFFCKYCTCQLKKGIVNKGLYRQVVVKMKKSIMNIYVGNVFQYWWKVKILVWICYCNILRYEHHWWVLVYKECHNILKGC